jgi:peptide/nickel transport system substrate-binding protein
MRLPALLLPLLILGACDGAPSTGPVAVSAIGKPPALVNPNLEPLDPPRAFLLEAAAQGLVRFDAAGQIEPALAQRWIVSDDGLRYTFRLARLDWPGGGGRITAQQVAQRLRAAAGRASRNPLKPILGAVQSIDAMTPEVIEIVLKSPRPNFLQLLAQPELAVLRGTSGSGPYRAEAAEGGAMLLSWPRSEDPDDADEAVPAPVLLRGEPAATAVARFAIGAADLVTGGTAGDLPLARAARLPAERLQFDPVVGLYGLAFVREGAGETFTAPAARRALAMTIDRAAYASALAVPGLQPRDGLLPAGLGEVPQPAQPDWAALPMAERRAAARAILAETVRFVSAPEPLAVRVAMPEGPGYSLLFAHLKRDWSLIGVTARRVAAGAPADLRLVDTVAPAGLASWYLRHFTCAGPYVCDTAADEMLEGARIAPSAPLRRALLANADRILSAQAPFIALAPPVRWSLVSPRLTGFRPNPFGRHAAGELIAASP